MFTFSLFDVEYGRGKPVKINPAFVELVVEGERRCYGSHFETAQITMHSGAVFTVIDSGRQVAPQIAEATSRRAQQIINDLELKAMSANARMAELEGLLADVPLAALLAIEEIAPLIARDRLNSPEAWMRAWEEVSPWLAALQAARISPEPEVQP